MLTRVSVGEVQPGTIVYIDNYQNGKFPQPDPRISGPYRVVRWGDYGKLTLRTISRTSLKPWRQRTFSVLVHNTWVCVPAEKGNVNLEIKRRYSRLLRAMIWVGILSHTEAEAAIRDYKAGLRWSGEAVNHFGGTRAILEAAWRNRHNAYGATYRSSQTEG